jgi:G:T-mismatch repair DNA endonuclease (very short patch repair protein)
MSRIRSRDTKPEPAVRSIHHRFGYRFTVNAGGDDVAIYGPVVVLAEGEAVGGYHCGIGKVRGLDAGHTVAVGKPDDDRAG